MATLVELGCEIDARMHRGASFTSIEDDVIDTSDLSEEQKSALWLYGWSFVALDAQRREAGAHIAQLAAIEVRGTARHGRKVKAFLSETDIEQDISGETFLLEEERTDMTGFEEA